LQAGKDHQIETVGETLRNNMSWIKNKQ